ncbi:MAG: alpha-mannosidase [Spirochaetaceae bacterium]|nr:MAG: alpha-mannosidase [Spirochaetaceae bacterium]
MSDARQRLVRSIERSDRRRDELLDIVGAELDFAGFLCGRHPDRAAEWRPLVEQASAAVAEALDGAGASIDAAVAEAERILMPLSAAAKQITVTCVGHAHIDMNWMWSWPETVAATIDSFHTVLQLMEEFPRFIFSQSQASVYRIVEEHDPELLARIIKAVADGRWEVTASHWVECDKNLSGADSLVRHLLYTRRYMNELFGLSADDVPVDWSPDTFGHAATVPTYLARGGVRYLYLHRPGTHGAARPLVFRWVGPDGAEVLAINDMHWGYNGVVTAGAIVGKSIRFVRESDVDDVLFVYGVGDHGGGPTRRDLRAIESLGSRPLLPAIDYGTGAGYFARLDSRRDVLPTITGELNFEFTGCYTSQSLIKRANRIGEARTALAEHTCAIDALLSNARYPHRVIEEAWRDVLLNQFHDILPGSGVHDTRTFAHGIFQRAMATVGTASTRALRAIASLVDTSGFGDPLADPLGSGDDGYGAGVGFASHEGGVPANDLRFGAAGRPFVVFNTTAFDREEVIECAVWDDGTDSAAFEGRELVVDRDDGTTVAAQCTERGRYWGHRYARIRFPVRVPSMGYAVVGVREVVPGASPAGDAPAGEPSAAQASTSGPDAVGARQVAPPHPCGYSWNERGAEGVENGLIRLVVDPETGGIASLRDLVTGRDLIAHTDGPTGIIEFVTEHAHPMSSWHVDHESPAGPVRCVGVHRDWSGPFAARVVADLRFGASDFRVEYELRAGDPSLSIRIAGTWFERGGAGVGVPAMKLRLAFALAGASAHFEVPFGSVDRGTDIRSDLPTQRWVALRGNAADGSAAAVVVANDSKYGCAWDGTLLRVPLIRGSYDPDPTPEVGAHEMRFTVRPIDPADTVAAAYREGLALNAPLIPVSTGVHDGTLPTSDSFVRVGGGAVGVSSLKQSESGELMVVTLHTLAPSPVTVTVRVSHRLAGRVVAAHELDLMEQPLRSLAVAAGDEADTIDVAIPSGGIVQVGFRLERSVSP